jgi:FHA domain-containing protein
LTFLFVAIDPLHRFPMILTLLAVSLNEQALSQPITAHFDSRGGTLGRADHNTMALPDPERHVSRVQAEISASASGYVIRNVGTANPIAVSGRVVATGESTNLAHGDEIRVGGYLLHVESRGDDAAREITRGRAMLAVGTPSRPALAAMPSPAVPLPPAPATASVAASVAASISAITPDVAANSTPNSPSSNPFADLLGAAPRGTNAPLSADPFADLLGGSAPAQPPAIPAMARAAGPALAPGPAQLAPPPRWAAAAAPSAGSSPTDPFADLMPQPAGLPASSRAVAAPPPAMPRLPDDFDPFAASPAPPARGPSALAASATPGAASGLFDDLIPAAPDASSIDALFGLGATSPDPLADFLAPPAAPAAGAGGEALGAGRPAPLSTDPMQALFGDLATPAAAAPQADHLPALNAAYQPPRRAAAPTAAVPAAAPAAAGPTWLAPAEAANDAQRLWRAFCVGAGVNLPMPARLDEDTWRELGGLMHSAVDGIVRLMDVRNSTKHELRAAVTVIQSLGNNPLKFSPNAQRALEHLLQPAMRGYLDGPAAIDDATQDLVGHAIGTMAGMRAAIDGMLERFAPQALEAKLSSKSVFDSVLPAQRKARLWDLYVQHYDSIRADAQDDFHSLFGKAFLVAYDQQVEHLKHNTPAS